MKATFVFAIVAPVFTRAIRILQTNDDGWATSPTRLLFDRMNETHQVVLSAPADNRSGNGNKRKLPKWRKKPCQFDTCPANSEPFGHDPNHTELNWVNSYASTAVQWGIETFGPAHWDGKYPELIVSGINGGVNIWLGSPKSSTIAAAGWAVNQHGIPAIAFSGYNKYNGAYFDSPPRSAYVYSELANKVVEQVIARGPPYLPEYTVLNVNFPRLRKECMSADEFRFVFTRVNVDAYLYKDQPWCGATDLTDEFKLLDLGYSGSSMPCTVSMSVMDSRDKTTANEHWKHRAVMETLAPLTDCPLKDFWENDLQAKGDKTAWKDHIGHRRPADDVCNHVQLKDEQDCRKARDEGTVVKSIAEDSF